MNATKELHCRKSREEEDKNSRREKNTSSLIYSEQGYEEDDLLKAKIGAEHFSVSYSGRKSYTVSAAMR